MNVENSYIKSCWRKSTLSNIFTFLYMVPFIIIISTSIINIFLPTLNNYNFLYRSNHNFVYTSNSITSAKESILNNSDLLLLNGQLFAHFRPELTTIINRENFENSTSSKIYFCKQDYSLKNTYFNDKNFITKDNKPIPSVNLTYDLAIKLKVTIGDKVQVKFLEEIPGKALPQPLYIDLNVSGILKPIDDGGMALAVIDSDMFNKINSLSTNGYNDIRNVYFTNTELEDSKNMTFTTKRMQLDELNKFIKSPGFITSSSITLGFASISLFAILGFEVGFTLKRQRKNMIILSMLGMPIKQIRKLFIKMILLSYSISLIISTLIVKFLFLDKIYKVYNEPFPIMLVSIALLISGIIVTFIHAYRLKSI